MGSRRLLCDRFVTGSWPVRGRFVAGSSPARDRLRGQGQNRTADTGIFSAVLCQLSYLASYCATAPDSPGPMAPATGLEPATFTLTG